VALPLSFFPFFFLFLPILAPRSDGSEPPPPPLSSTTFLFITLSSDLVWCRGDLLESLGGSSFQQIPSLFSASIGLPSGRRDLLRRWMFDAHRVWGFFPAQVFIIYPTLGKDYLKLFFLKSPCHTQIERKIRFDPVVCLAGIKDLNLPLFWTLAAVVALVSFWSLVKHNAVFCCCCYVVVGFVAVFVVVVVVVFFLFLYCFLLLLLCFLLWYNLATLCVGFTTLFVGFCFPLCRDVVLLLLLWFLLLYSLLFL
jgi:hypothetical protein